jgi:uroporphyrinogen-III synthase
MELTSTPWELIEPAILVSMNRRPRILITRTRQQASALAERLEAMGAETILVPTIELVPPGSFSALDDAVAHVGLEFDWLIFTSANAVRSFVERARLQGIEPRPRRIAVIGPATAKAVEAAGISPDIGPVLMPKEYVAESLAEALLGASGISPKHYLLVRAEEARDILPSSLEAAGHRVTIAPAYRNLTPPETIPALMQLFSDSEHYPDIITFTSSSTARNLFALLDEAGLVLPAGIALASIGPITSRTLEELDRQATFVADEPTIDSLAAAIAVYLSHPR